VCTAGLEEAVKRGHLISLDGLDGAGKSTQVARLAQALEAAGHDVVCTREPTPGPFGQRIRAAAASGRAPSPEDELAWFMADRREHVDDLVRPSLDAGRVVVTDRYYLSTVAYQGARGLDWQAILAASERAFVVPSVALVLEVDPKRGLERVHARGDGVNPIFEELAFLRGVAAIFDRIDRPYVVRVAGDRPADDVHAAIAAAVRERTGLL
jgi:dTMP kinase